MNLITEDASPSREEVYEALVRSLRRRKGFGIVFIQCSPAEATKLIKEIQTDLPQKHFANLNFDAPIDNLYDIVAELPNRENLNILFIQGLEKSLEPYIKPGYGGDGDYYNLDTVPIILSHLNQRRELFRDHFHNICFVFFLPLFAIKYIIRRSPDLYDWSAGVFEFTSDGDLSTIRDFQPNFAQKALITIREFSNRLGGNPLYKLGNLFHSLGYYKLAINFYQQALITSRIVGSHNGERVSLSKLGDTSYHLGQYEQSINFYQKYLITVREIGNRWGEGYALCNIGSAYYSLRDYEQAINCYEQSLVITREINDYEGEFNALGNLGRTYEHLAQYEEAIRFYQQCLIIIREIGDRTREGYILGDLGSVYNILDQYEEAIRFYQQCLIIIREIGDRTREGYILGNLGRCYYFLTDYSQAISYYEQYLTIMRDINKRNNEVHALKSLAEAYQALGEVEVARQYCQQALVLATELGIPLAAECDVLLLKLGVKPKEESGE